MSSYFLLSIRPKLAACVFILCGLCTSASDQVANGQVNDWVDMTCFPPPNPGGEPGIGPPPPCLLPADLDPEFVSPNPSGKAHVVVNADGTTQVDIKLTGVDPDLVLTAWTSYFFPGGPIPHPVFESLGAGQPAIAGVSAPLSPTYAGFTEGLGPEPNQFEINANGVARLRVDLDFNPLLPDEGPLRNDLVITNQGDAPAGSGFEQPLCCPNGLPAPTLQSVGSSLLRTFDMNTGFQILDETGKPVLARSPLAVAFIAIVVHIDKTTHGINPGVPILPIPGISATTGDHFLLGIFDLRALHPGAGKSTLGFSGIHDRSTLNEQGFQLSGIYPNPFNPSAAFQVSLTESQEVNIEVYDMLGRSVARIHQGQLEAGRQHMFTFNAEGLASGKYMVSLRGETFNTTRQIALVK